MVSLAICNKVLASILLYLLPFIKPMLVRPGIWLNTQFTFVVAILFIIPLVAFIFFLRKNKSLQNDLTHASDNHFISVKTARTLLFFGSIIIPLASVIYAFVTNEYDIKFYSALSLSTIIFLISLLTFFSSFIQKNISTILVSLYSLATIYFLFLVFYSDLNAFFIFSQLIVISLGAVIFNKTRRYVFFGALVFLLSLSLTLFIKNPQFNPILYLLIVVSTLFVSIFSIYIRLSLTDKLIFADTVINDGTSLVMAANNKGDIIYINKTFTDVLGFSENEVLGQGWWKVRKVISNDNNPYDKIKKGQIESSATVLLETKSKGQRWIQWNNTKLKNGVFVGIGTDITERREYEHRFRLLVEGAKDIIYTTDDKGILTYVNDSAALFTEYSKEELIGLNYIELVSDKYRRKVNLFYSRQLKTKNKESYFEFPFNTKSGKTLWVGQSVLFKYDKPDGKLISTQVICHDVTDRVIAEEKLKQHNADLSVINRVKEIILSSDNLVFTYEQILLHLGKNSDKTAFYNITIFSKNKNAIHTYSLNVKDKKVIKNTHPISPDLIDLVTHIKKHNLVFESDGDEAELYAELHQPVDIYKSAIIMPIKVTEKTYGFVGVFSNDANSYGVSHDILVGDICDSLASFFVQYEQRQIIEETRQRLEIYSKQLEILNDSKARLISCNNLTEVYSAIIELLYDKIENVFRVSILVHDAHYQTGHLYFKDKEDAILGNKRITTSDVPTLASHLKGIVYEIPDLDNYPHQMEEDKRWHNKGVKSIVSFPLIVAGKLFASVNLLSKVPNNFTDQQKVLTYEISESAVMVIEQIINRDIIATKNKDIADNISYAKRIQSALMPAEETLTTLLPDSFLIFSQRDSLGGDFYWFEQKGDNLFIAAGDCTGHGVSGSLLTILASGYIKQAVEERNISDPALILQYLNNAFQATLNKYKTNENELLDGLDISLGVLNKKTNLFMFSGAMHSMYLIRNNALTEIKGNRKAIGVTTNTQNPNNFFATEMMQLQKDDLIYFTTDGYTDQAHFKTDKRYGRARLKQLILQISHKTMFEQKQIVLSEHEKWKGNSSQTDDICLVAFKIT